MSTQQVIDTIGQIHAQNPNNLMAKHFNPQFYQNLDSSARARLEKIIATGIQNPTSDMGAYAMHPDDYDLFAQQLAPMIREFHRIPEGTKIAQIHDWNTTASPCDLGQIDPALKQVSMRVRVARNVSTFPLPGAMNKAQRLEFEQVALNAFEKLIAHPDFGGKYLSISPDTPNTISDTEYNSRVAAHQMFKDMSHDKYLNVAGISGDWPNGRGMYISQAEDFIVWVGEEDHLRIMSMQTGGDLSAPLSKAPYGPHDPRRLIAPLCHVTNLWVHILMPNKPWRRYACILACQTAKSLR